MGLTDPVSAGKTGRVAAVLATKGHQVYAVPPNTMVFEALEEMARHNIGALVVLQDDRLLGIFSERDYARSVALQGRASRETRVLDVMSDRLVTVASDTTIAECMQLMTDRRIRHLPVVEQGRVVGIISIGDVVNFIIDAQRDTIHHLQGYIAGSYPG
jgi:CBS domain-containing protein